MAGLGSCINSVAPRENENDTENRVLWITVTSSLLSLPLSLLGHMCGIFPDTGDRMSYPTKES